MDQKEIKSALKIVKESLDQKDYRNAIKQCKSILKVDRNNYLALVFYGAAVQETEQKSEALKAFKKAIEISPEHLLAWRGLASYYEKNEDNDLTDLSKIYARLLILEPDESKLPELVEKFEKLSLSQSDTSNMKLIFDSINLFSDQKKLLLQQCLVKTLSSSEANLPEDLLFDYQKLLEELISFRPHLKNHADLVKMYLKLLYKLQNITKLVIEATDFLDVYPDDVTILEWICKSYSELSDSDLKDLGNYCPKSAFSKLLQIEPESYLALFCKGVYDFHSGDYLNANESFKEAVKVKPKSGIAWFNLCLSQVLLYQFPEGEESALKALSLLKKNEKILICKVKLLQCLSKQSDTEKLEEAKKLGKELIETNPDDMETLQYLAATEINLGKFTEAEEYLKILGQHENYASYAKYLRCIIFKRLNQMEYFKKSLEDLVSEIPNHYEAWLELGKLYYDDNNYDSCLSSLLKSAKLNQWCYESFLLLGHCYRTMVQDLEKARRCYQKAYQLNPMSAEVGISLSDVYRILGKQELNMQLLSTATTLNPRSKWAWLKLGLHYLSLNLHQNAVNSLRVAVRLDANDKNAWECLGDAYFAQGAYTSALKSYQRVRELDSDSIYPMLQNASIKHLIGLFHESVQEFRLINEQIPDYIPALKNHAEACLSLVRQHLSQNMNGLAHDSCQEAVNSLIKCLRQRKDLICIWKLLGDACALLSSLPEKYCKLKLASWLISNAQSHYNNEVILDKCQILKLGSRSYCQALALNPGLSRLWYDLAFIYNRMVEISKTEGSRKQVRELACSAVKKSILLEENSWESWNLYGIILVSKEIQNYRLGQHCFIKAILQHDTNAITWTNLGTLYLVLDDLQIANQSFTEAQRCDHDYVFCWVGQAIIAQKTRHHDAMDLFRHSTQLGFSGEGCLGYANLVCVTLLNTKNKNDKNYLYSIKNMNAITVATDLITWFTDRYPTDPWAWNVLGLLLERQMLYKRSVEAFGEALNTARSKKITENNKDENANIEDKILLNYSRILSNLKRYKEAVDHLKQIKKATFTNQCELAAAYFKAKLYEEAYASYETALEWLASDTELKSHILVAMAAVVYLHQGQEDAKILLMQSCQLKPPSVEGLFALCALGMLHSDLALSELALRELNEFKDDIRYLDHIAVFQAYIYLFKGLKERAIRALGSVIYRHPNQPSLWLSLSLLLLHLYPSFDCRCAARSAEVALITGRSSIDVSKVMSLVSLSYLLSDEGLRSLRSSQKAVHMFPDVTENWVVLVASVLSKCLVRQSLEEIFWLKKMITYIRRKFESSKPMTQWLSNNNRKIAMMAEKLVICFLLVVIVVVSAGYLSYDEAYLGAGAYGHHGPFAVSYRARVDAPRQDAVALASVPFDYHY